MREWTAFLAAAALILAAGSSFADKKKSKDSQASEPEQRIPIYVEPVDPNDKKAPKKSKKELKKGARDAPLATQQLPSAGPTPKAVIGPQHGEMARDAQQMRQLKELEAIRSDLPEGSARDPMTTPGKSDGLRDRLGRPPQQGGTGGPERAFDDPMSTAREGQKRPGTVIGPSGGSPKDWMSGAARDAPATKDPSGSSPPGPPAPFVPAGSGAGRPAVVPGTTTSHEYSDGTKTTSHTRTDGTRVTDVESTEVDESGRRVEITQHREDRRHLGGGLVMTTRITRSDGAQAVIRSTNDGSDHVQSHRSGDREMLQRLERIRPARLPGADEGADADICATMPWLAECEKAKKDPDPGANPGTPQGTAAHTGPRLRIDSDDLATNPRPEGGSQQGQPKLTSPESVDPGPGARPPAPTEPN